MSFLHVVQIKAALKKLFDGRIDLDDYAKKPEAEREAAFATRSLAAYAVFHLADTDEIVASAAVVDGFDDNGIDAIHYDAREKVLYRVRFTASKDPDTSLHLFANDAHLPFAGRYFYANNCGYAQVIITKVVPRGRGFPLMEHPRAPLLPPPCALTRSG